jgi:DNA processing protein
MSSRKLDLTTIPELKLMKKIPKELFARGDISLLNRDKVSIVGTRRPSSYTKEFTYKLADGFAKLGYIVVSGGAMGVDATAHRGAGVKNSILVAGSGLNIKYPAVNRRLIEEIEEKGLLLSLFKDDFKPTKWSFVVRNELVVALGKILIVPEADLNSGSLRSVEFALRMKKDIYTIPQRLNESRGTNKLLSESKIKCIYDIDEFLESFRRDKEALSNGKNNLERENTIFEYLKSSPSLDEAYQKFGDRIFELELEGSIKVADGRVILLK